MSLHPIWTVRNLKGQFIGTFRAKTADQAISRLIDEQSRTAATFKKSQPTAVKRGDFTATVEPQP